MNIQLIKESYKGQDVLLIKFPFNNGINNLIRKLPRIRWSGALKSWHLPYTDEIMKEAETLFKENNYSFTITDNRKGVLVNNSILKRADLPNESLIVLAAYTEMLKLKNYSDNTIKNYRDHFIPFLLYFNDKNPAELTKMQILDYLVMLRNKENWSVTLQNQKVNAIKFFFEKLLNKKREVYDLPRAKKEWKLPTVFSVEEIKKILGACDNLKHQCMLCLAYSGGLRISEIVKLKPGDIDSARMVITIRQSKGRKDRQVMLSNKLLLLLREYFIKYKPKEFLFEGQFGGMYSKRS